MIEAEVKELAKGPSFGVISTLMPNGLPSTHMMWIDCDDEYTERVILRIRPARQRMTG